VQKALFIVGPTASGKTGLAFKVSQKIPSILIEADSVHVFRGTDIISGKDIPLGSKFVEDHYVVNSIPLYLIDQVSPTEEFSVFDFVNGVKKAVEKSISENKIPIIVGGTRFFIDALTNKIDTLSIPQDSSLRKKLSSFSVDMLQKELKRQDPEKSRSMNNSDVNNPRRLVRAIEVAGRRKKSKNKPLFREDEILMIGLNASYGYLKKKIDARLEKRLEQGALEEAHKMFENYEKLSEQIKNTHGFKQLFEHFKGKISFPEALEKWRLSEYHLAKEQLAWLSRKPNVYKYNIEKPDIEAEVLKLIEQNFSSPG